MSWKKPKPIPCVVTPFPPQCLPCQVFDVALGTCVDIISQVNKVLPSGQEHTVQKNIKTTVRKK